MSKKNVLIVILLVLFVDQVTKIYIKTHFELGQELVVFDWFKILFVENDGMAWGAKLSDFSAHISDKTAKLVLTLFRLVALAAIGYWLYTSIKKKSAHHLIYALALIFSGALGNIIDSVFYGVIFSSSYGQVATLFPDTGYAPLFYGSVVDMIQFPLATWNWPNWMPFIGGEEYTFFEYVFNLADSYISTGVIFLLVFNKKVSI